MYCKRGSESDIGHYGKCVAKIYSNLNIQRQTGKLHLNNRPQKFNKPDISKVVVCVHYSHREHPVLLKQTAPTPSVPAFRTDRDVEQGIHHTK